MTNSRIRPVIGLVTLGQRPRPEYDALHTALFHSLGQEVDLVSRHALDGLSASEIDSLQATDDEAAIHSNVPGQGGFTSPLGPDWSARWISRNKLVPLVQRCVDELETVEGVDVTICCVAEAFPAGSFSSRRPFVFPASAMLAHAQILAVTRPDATIGMIVHGIRQREQQKQSWRELLWAQALDVRFAGDNGLDDAIEELRQCRPDLVLVWAYAAGFGPTDPADRLAQLAGKLGAPLIVPAIAATLFARNFLLPSKIGMTSSNIPNTAG